MDEPTPSPAVRPVRCLNCGQPLPPRIVLDAGPGFHRCGFCRHRHRVILFPALLREIERGRAGEKIRDHAEAACFYHSDKRAVIICEDCGRFLCALCDLPVNGRHICPACFEKIRVEDDALVSRRIRYDNIALALALLSPLVMFPMVVVTAPLTLYLVFRFWNRPGSLVESGHWRLGLAAAVAVIEILGTVGILVAVFT